MNHYEIVKSKLEKFIHRYYVNELIKGLILFFAIGALYFLCSVLIENFFWLDKLGRTILFWLFIIVEIILFTRFIILPIFKLFRIVNGINYINASKIIGDHFPEVQDKLLNILQLKNSDNSSELLLASIEQKSAELNPIPFKLAINFNKNIQYLKYAAIPILLFIAISLIESKDWFTNSYDRMVNYKVAYEAPAPYKFVILNESLNSNESENFKLIVKTEGKVLPEQVNIHFKEEVYFLKNRGDATFEYEFIAPKSTIEFNLQGNDVVSRNYKLNILEVPKMQHLKMELHFPEYLKMKNDVIEGTGNTTIPEGTIIKWIVDTKNTKEVQFKTRDTNLLFNKKDDLFDLEKNIFSNINYTISTTNDHLKEYERLTFEINVIKDQYPEIKIQSKIDSTNSEIRYFLGEISDDYGIQKLQLIYYDIKNPDAIKVKELENNNSVYDQFAIQFPGELDIKDGNSYEFYFEVFDNDQIHGYKKTKSELFSYNKLSLSEREKKQLLQQNETISDIDKTLDKLKDQNKELKEISKLQKEKKNLNFNDKKKLDNFLKRQKQQEQMMQKFGDELKKNLEEFEKENKDDSFKNELKERLERNEKRLKKNEELLKELEKVQDKISKEKLSKRLEKLSKQNKSSQKNLEQLLELTKRYYVSKKQEKIADELEKLAKKQEELSKASDEQNKKEEQDKLNKEFEKIQKELKDLKKENKDLKKPMKMEETQKEEQQIKKEQEEASDKLEQQEKSEAQKKQKSASQKMKKMSAQMKSNMKSGSSEKNQEDIEMLRQILDNLVEFSLGQEVLMKTFKSIEPNNPTYANKLKRQSVLRENFRHIDDSLYALALRNPKIKEEVTDKLTDIEYNIDKSLERLSENQISQGASSQQYTVTGANDLAYMLSQSLDNMNMSMSSSGSQSQGKKSQGFQLPDIIEKQESLGEQMKEGIKKGKKKGEGEPSNSDEERNSKEEKGNSENKKGESEGKGKGKGNKNGENSNGGEGDSENSENDNEKLYEIYKQQQQLRNDLENKLKENGLSLNEKRVLDQMKQAENEILNNGFDQKTLSRMINIKHQLLKLEDATLKQGEKEERKSDTNEQEFQNSIEANEMKIKQYFNSTEILNRQVLPLRQNFKEKVQKYFKEKND